MNEWENENEFEKKNTDRKGASTTEWMRIVCKGSECDVCWIHRHCTMWTVSDIVVKRSTYVFFIRFGPHRRREIERKLNVLSHYTVLNIIQYNIHSMLAISTIRVFNNVLFSYLCLFTSFVCVVFFGYFRFFWTINKLFVFASSESPIHIHTRNTHATHTHNSFRDEFSCSVSLLMNMNANNQKRKHSNRLLLSKLQPYCFVHWCCEVDEKLCRFVGAI